MAAGVNTKQITNWALAGIGLTLGIVATKTVLNLVRGFVPVPLADL